MGTGEEPLERVGIRESWKQNPMVEGTLKKIEKNCGAKRMEPLQKGEEGSKNIRYWKWEVQTPSPPSIYVGQPLIEVIAS